MSITTLRYCHRVKALDPRVRGISLQKLKRNTPSTISLFIYYCADISARFLKRFSSRRLKPIFYRRLQGLVCLSITTFLHGCRFCRSLFIFGPPKDVPLRLKELRYDVARTIGLSQAFNYPLFIIMSRETLQCGTYNYLQIYLTSKLTNR